MSNTGSTSTPSRIRKIIDSAIDGGVRPTSIVCGISRSGTSRRKLSQAAVGANEPMPSVSKKLTMAPANIASMFGFARCSSAERNRTTTNTRIARASGTSNAINMPASPPVSPPDRTFR